MTIGPDFNFIAVPRTASNTMSRVFLPQFGGERIKPHHLRVVPEAHQGKFTFAVTRNPYDRVLSMWYHLRRHDPKLIPDDFPKFMDILTNQWGEGGLPVCKFLEMARVDCVLRYEHLCADCMRLPFNTKRKMWPHNRLNAEARQNWQEDLAAHPGWARLIEEHSAADFATYGYEKVLW